MARKLYLGLDQGTTGTTAMLFDEKWTVVAHAYKEHTQIYPEAGWVEHDAMEIWDAILDAISQALKKADATANDIACIGLDNQGETCMVWDPKTGKPVVGEYKTLNQESIIDFLQLLRTENKGKKIYVIWDNVSYQHAKAVKEAAKELKIKIEYLPGYSPNLNLIERYWGFLRKKIIVNKHYGTFEEFKGAILGFTTSKSEKVRKALMKYIPEKFHLIQPVST